MLPLNSTGSAINPFIATQRGSGCSTVNQYIDCLQEGNTMAVFSTLGGIAFVGLLLMLINCVMRQSTCCQTTRHVHRPIRTDQDLDSIHSVSGEEIDYLSHSPRKSPRYSVSIDRHPIHAMELPAFPQIEKSESDTAKAERLERKHSDSTDNTVEALEMEIMENDKNDPEID